MCELIEDFMTCSFCLKNFDEIEEVVAGQFCFICEECVLICNKIFFNKGNYLTPREIRDAAIEEFEKSDDYYLFTDSDGFLDGLLKPKQIYDFLSKNVVGQDEAKKALSLSIYNHFKRLKFNLMMGFNLTKSNVLMIGPSGSGKTYLIQTLSRLLNIPFAIADATTLTEVGYVGEDVESILQKLFHNSDYNPDYTEIGIIYIDEIDKISKRGNDWVGGRDVSGEGVQQALLKLIEGTICPVSLSGNRRNLNQNFINISTENILFICGGAFYGLDKIISERVDKTSIGFKTKNKKKNPFSKLIKSSIESEDLTKYGLIPELIGRLPVVTRLDELNVETLVKILTNPYNSILYQYNTILSGENIFITIDDDAAEIIAIMAYEKKTGARGLRNIVDKILSDVLFEAPSIDTLREIVIHKHALEDDGPGPILVHMDKFD